MKINRQGKSRTLSTEELDLVASYLPSEKHKLISLVLRKTAGRISEIVALKYENLTAGTILIPKEITKGKLKPREIPISEDLTNMSSVLNRNLKNYNSEVKITNSNGILIKTIFSNGGQAVWDGKDSFNNNVSSGVYYIFSSSEDGFSKAKTKVLVIR